MKGIVFEKTPTGVILMTREGEFINYEAPGVSFAMGEEVTLPGKIGAGSPYRKFIAVAASILLLITSGISYGLYYTPTGFVSIDVNPSLEISYNRFERILGIEGLNPDGVAIAKDLKAYRHDDLTDTVTRLIDDIENLGYLKASTPGVVLITVSDTQHSEAILQQVYDSFKETPSNHDVFLTAGNEANHQRYQVIGEKTSITPGKLNLIDKITPEPRENGPQTPNQGAMVQERTSLPENANDEAELARYQSHEAKGIRELVTEVQQGKAVSPVIEVPGKSSKGPGPNPGEGMGPEEDSPDTPNSPGQDKDNEGKESQQDNKKNGGN
ncbi:MAG: hypothetical protein AVO33_04170 [delta proteobacterium ML8_F1]|nr:MAG: hypothetical protein AVO33_04170 [delta proteobacterium ML8_F1]